jgi:hypothetical protein
MCICVRAKSARTHIHIYEPRLTHFLCAHIDTYMYACICVCVRERERERVCVCTLRHRRKLWLQLRHLRRTFSLTHKLSLTHSLTHTRARAHPHAHTLQRRDLGGTPREKAVERSFLFFFFKVFPQDFLLLDCRWRCCSVFFSLLMVWRASVKTMTPAWNKKTKS